jgi:hypothetical protein
VYVISATGGSPTRVTTGDSENGGPTWSSDGKYIYYGSNRTGRWEVWKSSLHGNAAVQLTQHGGGYAQESPDGKFVYFQKLAGIDSFDLLPEIWRIPSAGGTEELVITLAKRTEGSLYWFWRITKTGIYFVDNNAKPLPTIKFFDLAARQVKVVAQLEDQAWGGPGLSISPDGATAMYSQVENSGRDIMVFENFRLR